MLSTGSGATPRSQRSVRGNARGMSTARVHQGGQVGRKPNTIPRSHSSANCRAGMTPDQRSGNYPEPAPPGADSAGSGFGGPYLPYTMQRASCNRRAGTRRRRLIIRTLGEDKNPPARSANPVFPNRGGRADPKPCTAEDCQQHHTSRCGDEVPVRGRQLRKGASTCTHQYKEA